MKAIDISLKTQGYRIFDGNDYLNENPLEHYWDVVDGKLEPILYYISRENCSDLFGSKPDVILMLKGKGKKVWGFLWKIEV